MNMSERDVFEEKQPPRSGSNARAWKAVLDTPEGCEVLMEILNMCGIGARLSYDVGVIANYNLGMSILEIINNVHPIGGGVLTRNSI